MNGIETADVRTLDGGWLTICPLCFVSIYCPVEPTHRATREWVAACSSARVPTTTCLDCVLDRTMQAEAGALSAAIAADEDS